MGNAVCLLILLFTCPLFFSDRILTIMTMIGIAIISVHGLNILTGYCGQISIGHVGFMAVGAYTSAILNRQAGLAILGSPTLCCPGCRNSRFDLWSAITKD